MSNPQVDQNLAAYIFGQTGIPTAYTNGLQNLGFLGAPFGGVEQNFQAQQQFQRMLKDIMDKQMQAFNFPSPNINALPYNMRSLFNAASPLLTDPLYGIETAPGFFSNGYQYGGLPNDPTRAFDIWKQQTMGYPNYPAPNVSAAQASSQSGGGGGGGGGGGSSHTPVGHYQVDLPGGGSINVNASSQEAARTNAGQETGMDVSSSNIKQTG